MHVHSLFVSYNELFTVEAANIDNFLVWLGGGCEEIYGLSFFSSKDYGIMVWYDSQKVTVITKQPSVMVLQLSAPSTPQKPLCFSSSTGFLCLSSPSANLMKIIRGKDNTIHSLAHHSC
jgi:hypothetical protein